MTDLRRTLGRLSWHGFVRCLCALSLVLAVFAHRPAFVAAADTQDLSAYTLPDGSTPLLCVTSPDDGGKTAQTSKDCEFCRLAAAILLPQPERRADVTYLQASQFTVVAATEPPRDSIRQPAAPLRGPPSA